MPTPFLCQKCGAVGTLDGAPGELVDCPQCGVLLTAGLSAMPPAPPQPTGVLRRHLIWPKLTAYDFEQMRITAKSAAAGAIIVAFLLTLRVDEGTPLLLHYASLLAGLAWVSRVAVRRAARPWLWWLAAPAIFGVVMTWWHFDYGVSRWVDEIDGQAYRFTDWRRRGTSHLYYREVDYDDEFGMNTITMGFSESGKKHGPYEHSILSSFDDDQRAELEAAGYEVSEFFGADLHEWYWYGEKITEGEWHLRND
jgi:hypothetical protein